MTQLSDDCFAFGGPLMRMDDALALLRQRLHPIVETETVPLGRAIRRILAADLVSRQTVPPRDNAAVDGYAVRAADLSADAPSRLRIAGLAAAGHPMDGPLRPGSAARIFTGAFLPDGADSVVMQEDVTVADGAVAVPPGLKAGANRRRAGEDIAAGATVLRAGRCLRPQDIGLAAAAGHRDLSVFRRLAVALFSTGDELAEPGSDLASGQIFDSNRFILAGMLRALGCAVADMGIVPDDAETVRRSLGEAAAGHDLVITSGGVSTGEADHVRGAVAALGRIDFWRLAIRPGRPIALGQIAGTPFLGLPGNPVAAMVCFQRFARPLILRLGGAAAIEPLLFPVRAGFDYDKKPTRREWIRASLVRDPDGGLRAQRFPRQGSGILSSMVESDGLIEIAEEVSQVRRDGWVDFLPYPEVLA